MGEQRALHERSGPEFDPAMMIEARAHTRAAIAAIAQGMTPGMAEEDAQAYARATLKARGLLRGWHGVKLRFGTNTIKGFSDASDPGTILREDDIFFIDIGPVWQGYEGDGGDTFVVGNDAEMHRATTDVRAIFDATRARWLADGLSGAALYRFAAAEAERRGWQLNLDMSGHRLSDFPHAVKYDGALIDSDYAPSPGLWVLEIQIRHQERPFGAFYEDLLLA